MIPDKTDNLDRIALVISTPKQLIAREYSMAIAMAASFVLEYHHCQWTAFPSSQGLPTREASPRANGMRWPLKSWTMDTPATTLLAIPGAKQLDTEQPRKLGGHGSLLFRLLKRYAEMSTLISHQCQDPLDGPWGNGRQGTSTSYETKTAEADIAIICSDASGFRLVVALNSLILHLPLSSWGAAITAEVRC